METYSQSQTVTKLVELIGTGKLSVIGAVDLANCMIEDGADHEAVCAFSSLGTNGQNPQNCERDLHRWLEGLGMRLQPYTVTMDLQVLLITNSVCTLQHGKPCRGFDSLVLSKDLFSLSP